MEMPMFPATVRMRVLTQPDGEVGVCGARVLLDQVAAACRAGATAEQIARELPGVSLREVDQLTAYYLTHASEVDSRMLRRRVAVSAVSRQMRVLVRSHGRSILLPAPSLDRSTELGPGRPTEWPPMTRRHACNFELTPNGEQGRNRHRFDRTGWMHPPGGQPQPDRL
jgi:hypothetical protein